jgi:predicted DNA-binding protein with PD1-like motif
MRDRSRLERWLGLVCLVTTIAILLPPASAADPTPAKISAARIQEVYHVRVTRDGHLIESVMDAIKQNNIVNGAILTGIGSLQECAYHRSKSLGPDNADEFYTVKGAMELLNLAGVITGGKPHIHITFSNEKGAFGGHLDDCRVLRSVELVIVKYAVAQ